MQWMRLKTELSRFWDLTSRKNPGWLNWSESKQVMGSIPLCRELKSNRSWIQWLRSCYTGDELETQQLQTHSDSRSDESTCGFYPASASIFPMSRLHFLQKHDRYLVYKRAHEVDETALHLGKLLGTVSVHHGLSEEEEKTKGVNRCSEILRSLQTYKYICVWNEEKGSYNWLLVQNISLQIALFPELSSDHQRHLETKRQRNKGSQRGQKKRQMKSNTHILLSCKLVLTYSVTAKLLEMIENLTFT